MKLLSPGPVPIPDFVLEAISQPVIHHRSASFRALYQDIQQGLQYLFQSQYQTVCFAGSGTYGMEMAIYSLFQTKDQVLVLSNGKFSHRWAEYGSTIGLEVVPQQADWGKGFDIPTLLQQLEKHPKLKGMVITHCETATGQVVDLEEISFAIKKHRPDLLILVDAITSVGVMPFFMDDWEIDLAITASQKALMNPTGLVAACISPLAEGALAHGQENDFCHLKGHVQKARDHQSLFSAPVNQMYGLQAALNFIQKKSLPVLWNAVLQQSRYVKQAIRSMGGQIFGESDGPSVTAFSFPNVDSEVLRNALRDQHQLYLAGGQGPLKGKILRVGHFGSIGMEEMQELIQALKQLTLS